LIDQRHFDPDEGDRIIGAIAAVQPSDPVLQAYGLGKLDNDSADSVSKHLDDCGACQRSVTEMSSDSFLGNCASEFSRTRAGPNNRRGQRWSAIQKNL
jgi:anti-sigma factor RsiW